MNAEGGPGLVDRSFVVEGLTCSVQVSVHDPSVPVVREEVIVWCARDVPGPISAWVGKDHEGRWGLNINAARLDSVGGTARLLGALQGEMGLSPAEAVRVLDAVSEAAGIQEAHDAVRNETLRLASAEVSRRKESAKQKALAAAGPVGERLLAAAKADKDAEDAANVASDAREARRLGKA